jgi:hypothetical protein
MNAIKADPGVYSPERQCTSVAVDLAKGFGLEVPSGSGPYTWQLGSGTAPNPYALNNQLQQQNVPGTTESNQQYNNYMNQQAQAQQSQQQAQQEEERKKKSQ